MTHRTLPLPDVLDTLRALVTEAYEGPGQEGSWFVTARRDAGVFGTIARLGAAEASRAPRSDGPSIAAHAEHLRWTLVLVAATLRGAPWTPDWSASWSVQQVDERSWDELRAALRQAYDELMTLLTPSLDLGDPILYRGLQALAPHAAYHLGAMRQLARLSDRLS
jgi:hypothetical protein